MATGASNRPRHHRAALFLGRATTWAMVRLLATGSIIPPRSGYDARLPRRAVGGENQHGGREPAPARSTTEVEGRRHSRSVSQSQAGLERARGGVLVAW